MPSVHEGDIRPRRRYSTRSKQSDVYAKTRVREDGCSQSLAPENVVRKKQAEKLPPSIPEDLVAGQTKESEASSDVLKRIEQKLDNLAVVTNELVCQFERRAEDDGVVMSAQKDVIEQWKQEAGALVTTLRPVVGSSTTPAVSATVGAVEKDAENWGSVLAAGSVQAASESRIESNGELKPRKKEKPDPVVAATKVETAKAEKAEKGDDGILHPALFVAILLCVLSMTRYQVYSTDHDTR